MKPGRLPATSFLTMKTRRLRRPHLVWKSSLHEALPEESTSLFCSPLPGEPADIYLDQEREALVDLYGGSMLGTAGGSGRSATFGRFQLKGVGVTPAVAHDGEFYHSTGTLPLADACREAIFSEAFSIALPFGVVPVLSVWRTGATYPEQGDLGRRQRALLARPFAARPAHFLRNPSFLAGQRSAGEQAPGWTIDALRTRSALNTLADHFRDLLGMPAECAANDDLVDPAVLDAGLRMIARRYAAQCAAAFAKRLSHGSLTCSNLALDGRFVDFGSACYVPQYQRVARSAHWTDSWTEARAPISTIVTLRHHMARYLALRKGPPLATETELVQLYEGCLADRLSVEMAKMAGYTEDLVATCPALDRLRLLGAMFEVWSRGAGEAFMTAPCRSAGPKPPPKSLGRYDLSLVLMTAARSQNLGETTRCLEPMVNDTALLERFVRAYWDVREAVTAEYEFVPDLLQRYVSRQAMRKNADLSGLNDDKAVHERLFEIEQGDEDGAGSVVEQALTAARWILPDLDPELPGRTGAKQIVELARRT